jgi:metallo-beta-lactamase family protein
MKLTFLGATGTVTGSKYCLRYGDHSVLVDCGLFQGYKQLRLRNWAPLPIPAATLSSVILTHAHIDHSGYLPLLVKQGFRGPIYCTPATHALCDLLLRDSAHLQEEEAAYANRHGFSKHSPALPLYTHEDAEAALRHFRPVEFDRDFTPAPGVVARLIPAGHILGSAMVSMTAGRTILFSGDLGRPNDRIMRPPASVEHADYLVLESTYGDRRHPDKDPLDTLGRIITRTTARGGVVIVPSFAVGRAQSLLYHLHLLKASGALSTALRVYLDSPLAVNVTDLYVRHCEDHRLTVEQCHALGNVAHFVNTADESRSLDTSPWPMVIVAGSGMATGGRVLHHLKRFAPDSRNTILLVGFQAGGTRGAALLAGAHEIKIHGAYVSVRAEVAAIENLSAHADFVEMLEWLKHFGQAPARVFLTHGEPAAADSLRKHLAEALGWRAEVPDYLESVEL